MHEILMPISYFDYKKLLLQFLVTTRYYHDLMDISLSLQQHFQKSIYPNSQFFGVHKVYDKLEKTRRLERCGKLQSIALFN